MFKKWEFRELLSLGVTSILQPNITHCGGIPGLKAISTTRRGGQRKFFDHQSAMSDRIEMHATTLNPAIKSHETHTHAPAEIVIMMSGTTEMEIGGSVYPGVAGDVYFFGSNIPHAIRNTGTVPCTYLAFQWE